MIYKYIWLIFIFYSLNGFSLLNAETYHIIYVRGEILLKKDKTLLKTGMKVSSEDQLIFKNKTSKAVVTSNLRGRFVLMLNKPIPSSEFVVFAKDVLLPLKTNAAVSTRGTPKIVRNLADYFGDSTFCIIGNKLSFEADRSMYKIDENQYFEIQYKIEDSLVKKKLASNHNLITLNTQEVFKDKQGNFFIPQEVEVLFFINKPRSIKSKTRFQPIIIEKEELKTQYAELFKLIENQKLNDEEYHQYIYGYFKDVYGKTDENALESWLEENFKK